jgi:hypothetical protein
LALARPFGPPLVGPPLGLLLLLGLSDTNATLDRLRMRPLRNRDDRQNCSGKDKAVTCHLVSSPLIAELWRAGTTRGVVPDSARSGKLARRHGGGMMATRQNCGGGRLKDCSKDIAVMPAKAGHPVFTAL